MVPRTSLAAAVADPGTEDPGETVGKVVRPFGDPRDGVLGRVK